MKSQRKIAVVAFVGAIAVGVAVLGRAHESGLDAERTALLQKRELPDVPGKQVLLVAVEYRPGQASSPHVHPGSVIAFVAQGEIVSQLEGQLPVTYREGESWYEPPRVPHLVSRNASTTKPAKLLAWLLVDDGEKAKEPWPPVQ